MSRLLSIRYYIINTTSNDTWQKKCTTVLATIYFLNMSRNRNADSQQLMSVVLAHKRSCRLSLTDTFRISHRHIASTYLSRTHVASLTDTHYISFRNKCVYRREVLQCFHIPEAISWVALSVAIQTSSGWSNRSWWSMSHCKPAIV